MRAAVPKCHPRHSVSDEEAIAVLSFPRFVEALCETLRADFPTAHVENPQLPSAMILPTALGTTRIDGHHCYRMHQAGTLLPHMRWQILEAVHRSDPAGSAITAANWRHLPLIVHVMPLPHPTWPHVPATPDWVEVLAIDGPETILTPSAWPEDVERVRAAALARMDSLSTPDFSIHHPMRAEVGWYVFTGGLAADRAWHFAKRFPALAGVALPCPDRGIVITCAYLLSQRIWGSLLLPIADWQAAVLQSQPPHVLSQRVYALESGRVIGALGWVPRSPA